MRVRRLLALATLGVMFVVGSQSPASAGNKKKVQIVKNVKIKNNELLSGNCVSLLAPPCP